MDSINNSPAVSSYGIKAQIFFLCRAAPGRVHLKLERKMEAAPTLAALLRNINQVPLVKAPRPLLRSSTDSLSKALAQGPSPVRTARHAPDFDGLVNLDLLVIHSLEHNNSQAL